jgi:hypothetical protein
MRSIIPAMLSLAITAGAAFANDASTGHFRLEEYFTGHTTATGSFQAINGVHRKFEVDLHGSWNGRTLKLVENFRYADGERDRKTWRFTKTGANTYSGTREDVIGETKVRIHGNVAKFSYNVLLDGKGGSNKVRFYDTMRLNPDGTVLNTAWVTKYGLPVARTRVAFAKH